MQFKHFTEGEPAMKRLIFSCAVVSLLWACNRTHLSPYFGHATREAFASQVIDAGPSLAKRPDPGLDPEEAAIIAESYRNSLSPPKSQAARAPVVFVTDEPASSGPRGVVPKPKGD